MHGAHFAEFTPVQLAAVKDAVAAMLAERGGAPTPEALQEIADEFQFSPREVLWLLTA